MFDVVPVGHLAIDSISLPEKKTPFVVLGGSATYVSLSARHLDARVSIISKVGSDFPEAYRWWLTQEGIDLSNVVKVEGGRTTRFQLRYSNDLSERSLRLESRMAQITFEDVAPSLKAKAVHVGPIAGEITYDVAEVLKGHCEVMSIDPQGLVRKFDNEGNVSLAPPIDARVLELADIFKSSAGEIQALTGVSEIAAAIRLVHDFGAKIVIVTLGAKGAVVSVEDTVHDVPACKPERLVDPTGAGDAFMGGFLAEYVRGEDCSWCSCVGSAAASFVVEGVGPTCIGVKEEIYRRAQTLFESEIKK